MEENYNLYLDDYRDPWETANYIYPVELRPMYRMEKWAIVRNYNQFVEHINKFGLPDKVSFDHDLADEHYAPPEYWKDYETSKKYQEEAEKTYKEKTGYDCAKFLIEYCRVNRLRLPEFYCHSMNPVGKDNILNILNSASEVLNELNAVSIEAKAWKKTKEEKDNE